MAPKYKLVYFNLTALGEPIRYMFSYGKIEFEDSRFEMSEWQKEKPSKPFGKVPVLFIDGKPVHQSAAICRYLAKQLNLTGKDDKDALQIDMIVDTFADYRSNISAWFSTKDEDKPAKIEEIKKVHTPYYFERIEKIVEENGGYLVGGQLTWADIYFAAFVDFPINLLKENILDKYPKLKALKEKVDNLPGIKEYRAKRPECFA